MLHHFERNGLYAAHPRRLITSNAGGSRQSRSVPERSGRVRALSEIMSSLEDDAWWKRVHVKPKQLRLRIDSRVEFRIKNECGRLLTFKVKTTRHHSIFPNRTYGMIGHREEAALRVLYKPCDHDPPLRRSDHLTIAVKPLNVETAVSTLFFDPFVGK